MRTKIEGAEERANTAQCIADSLDLRANEARNAADATEQRAIAAQSNADVAKASKSYWNKSCEILIWHFSRRGRFAPQRLQLHNIRLERFNMSCGMPIRVWMHKA